MQAQQHDATQLEVYHEDTDDTNITQSSCTATGRIGARLRYRFVVCLREQARQIPATISTHESSLGARP